MMPFTRLLYFCGIALLASTAAPAAVDMAYVRALQAQIDARPRECRGQLALVEPLTNQCEAESRAAGEAVHSDDLWSAYKVCLKEQTAANRTIRAYNKMVRDCRDRPDTGEQGSSSGASSASRPAETNPSPDDSAGSGASETDDADSRACHFNPPSGSTSSGTYSGPCGEDGKAQGYGRVVFENGDRVEGMFRRGDVHGTARFTWADGGWFEGQYQLGGMRQGKRYWANGRTYEGAWVGDKQHGRGTTVWPSGMRYEGEYAAGKEHGNGTMKFADGGTYRGGWQHGLPHGWGTHTRPSGQRYEGQHNKGKKEGPGTVYEADGDRQEGIFKDSRLWQGTYHGRRGTCEFRNFRPVDPTCASLQN